MMTEQEWLDQQAMIRDHLDDMGYESIEDWARDGDIYYCEYNCAFHDRSNPRWVEVDVEDLILAERAALIEAVHTTPLDN